MDAAREGGAEDVSILSWLAPLGPRGKFTAALVLAMALAGSVLAQSAPPVSAPEPGRLRVPYFGHFSQLPVGAVQPRGWLRNWLERQASGLTGHPENLSYPYDTCLYAGVIPKPPYTNQWWSPWWPYEQSGYFVDGLTRLSWLIPNAAIDRRRDANLDYILNHSTEGSLGASHWCWPNAVVGRALMAQFSATGNPRIAKALEDELLANAGAITQRRSGKETFYVYRNGANAEEAFYLYGLTGDPRLREIGRKVYENYLEDTNSFCSLERILGDQPLREHGVTVAETLKCLPLMYLYTGDPDALRLARRAYQKVADHSLMPDGGMVSSEYLDPSRFDSLHESCDITDWSWSLGYLFMATGEARWADLVERTTFNALPGAVTKDFRQLQYFSGVNQIVLGVTNSRAPYCPTRMSYRAAHDTECCAGNINRAMPNYVIRMWMRSADDGLAAAFYGPSEVSTTLHGEKVNIVEDTDYPFGENISFRVRTTKPMSFDLQCRIPQWCSAATLTVNGRNWPGEAAPGAFVTIRREFKDGDVVNLKLPMPVRVEDWYRSRAICVMRGPLVYSLRIAERRVEHFKDPPAIRALLKGHDIQGFPELEFYPESDWRYGIAAALTNHLSEIRVVRSPLTDNPFIEAQTPIRLEVPLCHLPDWFPGWKPTSVSASGVVGKVPGEPPGLPTPEQCGAQGKPVTMELVPYGATHLRLTTLPLVVERQEQGGGQKE